MNHFPRTADEPTRRQFMATAAKTFLGVGLMPLAEKILSTPARAAVQSAAAAPVRRVGKAKHVIYLYMNGGMSHLDTLDVKPGTKEQGPTEAIPTSVDGIQLSEYLPRTARSMHHIALVNSLSSTQGAHEQGDYFMHTSYALRGTIRHPGMGAWMLRFQDRFNESLPSNVVLGGGSRHPGAGFMEAKYSPLMLGNPNGGLPNSRRRSGVTAEDFDVRLDLASKLDSKFQKTYDLHDIRAYSSMYRDAVRVMSSSDLAAFDLTKESKEMHAAYGESPFGQGCLLARRLVEHGVRFVEVSLGGWDTHTANFVRVPELAEILDRGLGTLLPDLEQRGLLEDTMVVLATEFGRTPDINGNEGRDHFPKVFSGLLAGAGIRGGQRYGLSDRGREVADKSVTIPDFNATIATALGLPIEEKTFSPSLRPFTIADKGRPVMDLLS